ncbi:MAG: hypothetical protein CMN32_12605 [Saprospirales bacterium]|nr:hypothetical protein [Saprospirales bacterium]
MDHENNNQEREPFFKLILDDPILLLFLGVVVFMVFYLAWGFIELGNVPDFPDELRNQVISK